MELRKCLYTLTTSSGDYGTLLQGVGNFTLECRADLFKDNHRRLSWTTALHRRMPGSP